MPPLRICRLSSDFHTKLSSILTFFFVISLGVLSLIFREEPLEHNDERILQDYNGDDYSGYSCNQMYSITVPGEQQCLFSKTCNNGEGVFAPFVFCHSWAPSTYCWLLSPLLLLWLITLFRMLGSTAEYFFSPSLEMFSGKMGLPPRFAGVTLLALGNGAADVSATISAICVDTENGYKLSLGALTGAAMFIGCIVAGCVIVVADGVPCRGALVRDATALLIAVSVVGVKLYSGVIGPSAVSLFISMYIFFVLIVLVADVYHRAVVLPRQARHLAQIEVARQVQEGQAVSERAADALNDLADEELERPRGKASRAIDAVMVALSNYGTTPANQSGWGVESQDILHERPVVLRGSRGLLTEEGVPHNYLQGRPVESDEDVDESTPYTAMLESSTDNVCVSHGSFAADSWRGAWHDATQELYFEVQSSWQDIFDEENSWFDKILMICEYPFLLARKLTVPIPCEGYYCRGLVALSLVLSPVWFGVYLLNEHEMNIFWKDGVSYVGILLALFLVIAALVIRFAPGGAEGVMSIVVSTPIALYGFFIAATWIDFIADKLVNLLDFLGIICRIPAPIMGLTILAWGNSMGDLSANLTMARKGLANMAMTACFAGPVFNILMGLGLGFSRLFAATGESEKSVVVTPAVLIGIIFIVVNSLLIIVTGVFVCKGRIPKQFGYLTLGLYMIYVVTSVSLEFSKYGDSNG
jgi:sodium/potassium/calcium exchanger 6